MTGPPPLQGRRITQVLASSTGGVGTHVRSVLPALLAAGAVVQVCGPAATDEVFGFSATGAAFRPVEIPAGPAPRADARAVAALRTVAADVMHAHGLRAGLVAVAAGRTGRRPAPSLVLTLHNELPDGGGPRARVLRAAGRAAVRAADLVLAASADLADEARRLGAVDVRMAPVSAPPLPPASRSAEDVRQELGVSAGQPLVVAVGRLHPQKGYDVLLRAVARWSHAPWPAHAPLLVIAGDGPLREELQRLVDGGRLPVALLGRRTDVADLLAAADLCVLPSRWEARSLTAQEALRAGTPLVATRTGGLPDLLGDAAELVDVDDADGLADAVVRLLTDPIRAEELAVAGRRRAAGWPDEAATAAQLTAVYRELLGRRAAGSR